MSNEQDENFRQQKKEQAAQGDYAAQQWIDKDNAVNKELERLGKKEMKMDRAQNAGLSIHDLETKIFETTQEREEHWNTGRPRVYQREARKEFDTKQEAFNNELAGYNEQMVDLVRKSSPEAINQLRQQLEKSQEKIDQAIAFRQGIAKLPSEEGEAQQPALKRQSLQSLLDTQRRSLHDDLKQQQQAGPVDEDKLIQARLEKQWQNQEQFGGQQKDHWVNKAAQEQQDDRKLEQTQLAVFQKLGRRGTDEEIRAYEKEQALGKAQKQAPPAQSV